MDEAAPLHELISRVVAPAAAPREGLTLGNQDVLLATVGVELRPG